MEANVKMSIKKTLNIQFILIKLSQKEKDHICVIKHRVIKDYHCLTHYTSNFAILCHINGQTDVNFFCIFPIKKGTRQPVPA